MPPVGRLHILLLTLFFLLFTLYASNPLIKKCQRPIEAMPNRWTKTTYSSALIGSNSTIWSEYSRRLLCIQSTTDSNGIVN